MPPSVIRWTHRILAAALAISGVALAGWTFVAPSRAANPIRAPLNAASCFGVAAILLLLLSSRPGDPLPAEAGIAPARRHLLPITALFILIACLFWNLAGSFFLSDDFILIHYSRTYFHEFLRQFVTAGGDGGFRPVTNVSFALTSGWAGFSPLRWHFISLAIHALNAALLYLLALRLGWTTLAAWTAAALFAGHGITPEAVVWITARFDLLATFFVLASMFCFVSSWQGEGHVWLWRAASLATMTLGMLSKESAYVLPMLLTLWVLLVEDGKHRFRALLPFWICAACVFMYRWMLFGGIGGYRDAAGGEAVYTITSFTAMKVLVWRLWSILFFPINWSTGPGWALGLGSILFLAVLFYLTRQRPARSLLAFTLGWVVICAMPPLHLLLIGPDLTKSRYLYLPLAGFCLLLGALAGQLGGRIRWAAVLVLCCFSWAATRHDLGAWRHASERAQASCYAAARCANDPGRIQITDLPRKLNGVWFFNNGFSECVAMQHESGAIPAPEAENASCLYEWDTVRDELRPKP
ncbi:MAG: hypothetical protein ABI759_03710 [Candidatus Solibacter sp.]